MTLHNSITTLEPQPEFLWPHGASHQNGAKSVGGEEPSLSIHLAPPESATGAAVVIFPGGGYGHLALDHEGAQIAAWLNARGIAAFVVRYSIAEAGRTAALHPAPLHDAQRALRIVRSRAEQWNLDAARIGAWGFSAGGHLVSTLATNFDDGDAENHEAIERTNCRPDFLILAYPVITLGIYAHAASRRNLLGENFDMQWLEDLSNETRVTAQAPPAFLFHTSADGSVPAENSVQFYLALRRAGVSAELHIYEHGAHGVGLAPADKVLCTWAQRLEDWLRGRGAM